MENCEGASARPDLLRWKASARPTLVVLIAQTQMWSAPAIAYIFSSEFLGYAGQTSTGTKMPRTRWMTMTKRKTCPPWGQVDCSCQDFAQPFLNRVDGNVHEASALADMRKLLPPGFTFGEFRPRFAEKLVETAT